MGQGKARQETISQGPKRGHVWCWGGSNPGPSLRIVGGAIGGGNISGAKALKACPPGANLAAWGLPNPGAWACRAEQLF